MKQHIFVATDGSDTAMKAVDLASEIATEFGVPLTVGHVLQFGRPSEELARMADVEHIVEHVRKASKVDFEIMTGTGGDLFADTRPSGDVVRVITMLGEEILRRAADRAKEMGVTQVETVSAQGDPADAILDMAEEAGADMIVLGHRGLGRLKTMLLGSVALKVTQHAPCTVVSVR
ncbi:universal stress protein [Roseovarius indicus]|uniref:Universal stress protein n=1 Tax=Roseovarius indicus TaxID=540747 RepID=A0A0T5P1V0_9RHOB|nr:universal stress protein [Roseovarius indicus]KRS15111.1 hypothetical protein XM52_25225 [Roseovarius indicus]QEW24754.1 Universal stress protein [Roseovarius indicus]SFE52241.1 Nucleotide-binding universal stress protein, UspA family [Roseovarius indicus]